MGKMVWFTVNVVVSLDTDKSRIVIYSQIIQLFEIIEYQPTEEKWYGCCVRLLVRIIMEMIVPSIITRKHQDSRKQLYINYGNRIVYNIFNL
jgi:hypothetical protein